MIHAKFSVKSWLPEGCRGFAAIRRRQDGESCQCGKYLDHKQQPKAFLCSAPASGHRHMVPEAAGTQTVALGSREANAAGSDFEHGEVRARLRAGTAVGAPGELPGRAALLGKE